MLFRASLVTAVLAVAGAASAQDQPVVFSAMGDVPYGSAEVAVLQQQISDHNRYSPSEFVIHLGDIKSSSSSCSESVYRDVAGYLKQLQVPTFVIPGDNEYNDCSSPSQAWTYWKRYFTDFEAAFCGAPAVERQSERHENFAFVRGGVLFIGINLVGVPVHDRSEWNTRLQQDADWVQAQLEGKRSQVRSAVLFGHTNPTSSHDLFFDQFVPAADAFGKPVLYLHGSGHSWIQDRPFAAANILRVEVNNGGDEAPVQVTVGLDATNPFQFLRRPWSNNPQPVVRPPCGGTAPASLAIDDTSVDEGDDGTVSAVFTVRLEGGDGSPVAVGWSASPGTAAPDSDYVPVSGSLGFSGTTVTQQVSVTVRGDRLLEPDETFFVDLAGATNATVTDGRGAGTIRDDDATSPPAPETTLRLVSVQDAYVSQASPTKNYGSAAMLKLKDSTSDNDIYLQFVAAGLGAPVQRATLRLRCTASGPAGGSMYLVANSYAGTTTPWVEGGIKWSNAPVIAGQALAAVGSVAAGAWYEFDVTGAVAGDGTYSFGVRGGGSNSLEYSSTEGAYPPELVLEMGSGSGDPPPDPPADPPAITGFTPADGPAGAEITIDGTGFAGTTAVTFAGTPAASFVVDSSTRLRARVPVSATTGRIAVTTPVGSTTSDTDFTVTIPPPASSLTFPPVADAQVHSSNSGTNYATTTTLRVRDDTSDYRFYLQFDVAGLGGPVQQAVVRLYCTNGSPSGGTLHLVSNDYLNSTNPWVETGLTWNNAPVMAGTPLAAPGAVTAGTWVEFDVTAAIAGDGIYSFGVWSANSNSAYYSSREGTNPPVLVLTTGSASGTPAGENSRFLPDRFAMAPGWPNPTVGRTTFEYALPRAGRVRLSVFDVRGALVRVVVDELQQPGRQRWTWDGRDAEGRRARSGIYLYRLEFEAERRTGKLVVKR